jgi:hypothetical protein
VTVNFVANDTGTPASTFLVGTVPLATFPSQPPAFIYGSLTGPNEICTVGRGRVACSGSMVELVARASGSVFVVAPFLRSAFSASASAEAAGRKAGEFGAGFLGKPTISCAPHGCTFLPRLPAHRPPAGGLVRRGRRDAMALASQLGGRELVPLRLPHAGVLCRVQRARRLLRRHRDVRQHVRPGLRLLHHALLLRQLHDARGVGCGLQRRDDERRVPFDRSALSLRVLPPSPSALSSPLQSRTSGAPPARTTSPSGL